MTFETFAQKTVAPNIFDAYANPNILLYLVLGNLLTTNIWHLSEKIQQRVLNESGQVVTDASILIKAIQQQINRSFTHLHTSEVKNIYGELDLDAERVRLGNKTIDAALSQIISYFELCIANGYIPEEGLRPVLDRIEVGRFPAYFYGNFDLVRASRKLLGHGRSAPLGLTSCVDETAIFSALIMTLPAGMVKNVVAFTSPNHTTAFGWNQDGTPWWFYGKNKLYFAQDWQSWVLDKADGDAQRAFNQVMNDVSRIISVAGTFDLMTGQTNIVEAHIIEIVQKMDELFGVRLQQLQAGLNRPRIPMPEDPLAPYLRSSLSSQNIGVVQKRLEESQDPACEVVLYSYRSLKVKNPSNYLKVAREQPYCKELAKTLLTVEQALNIVRGVQGVESVFQNRDRIAMPDETLRFGTGSDRDKALLLHVLLEHLPVSITTDTRVISIFMSEASYVCFGDRTIELSSLQEVALPDEPIVLSLIG
jgi:hypothetical protein